MPRLASFDAPGALYHVIIRGIERWNIFEDNNENNEVKPRRVTLSFLVSMLVYVPSRKAVEEITRSMCNVEV
jgi:hypothetical protein